MRRTRLRARPRERDPGELEAAAAWHRAVVGRSRACQVTGRPDSLEDPVECHHVIRQQVLRRRARELGLDEVAVVWDARIGMRVARSRHARHTNAAERIPREAVPDAAISMADELGLLWMIEREYPA